MRRGHYGKVSIGKIRQLRTENVIYYLKDSRSLHGKSRNNSHRSLYMCLKRYTYQDTILIPLNYEEIKTNNCKVSNTHYIKIRYTQLGNRKGLNYRSDGK